MRKVFCADVRMINSSGIGVYIHHFVQSILISDTYDVVLLGRQRELDPYFPARGYTLIEADFPIYSVQEQLKLPRLIPACDLFWAPHYNVPILPVRAKKFLVTIPDVFHLAFYHTLSLPQKLYAQVVMNVAVRKADYILTISQYSKVELVRFTGVRDERVQVIYLGIDKARFKPVPDEAICQKTRSRYQVPDKYILFVGNVKPNKNLRGLVAAFTVLLHRLPEHRLLIVGKKEGFITGDTELFGQIAANPGLKGHVSFTGYVDFEDLPVLYSMADVFAFPSVYEGFGFPPLEAMACGCPVVASNRASIPEVCGEAARYVDPGDATSFADALDEVITNQPLRTRLIEQGYRQAARYDWEQAGKAFNAVVAQLVQ